MPILRRAALAALAFAMPVVAFAADRLGRARHGPRAARASTRRWRRRPRSARSCTRTCSKGLTKINMDGKVTPLLAESWTIDPDGKVYTFKLREGRQVPRRRAIRLRAT